MRYKSLKYNTEDFHSEKNQSFVCKLEKKFKHLALPAQELFALHGTEEVLPLSFTLELLEHWPSMSAYQVARRGLSDPSISIKTKGRLTRVIDQTKEAQKFIRKHSGDYDPLCRDLAITILLDKLAPVSQFLPNNEYCLRIILLLDDLEKACDDLEYTVEVNLNDYDFSFMIERFPETYKVVIEGIDTARNHHREDSIIPLQVLSDINEMNIYIATHYAVLGNFSVANTERSAVAATEKYRNQLVELESVLQPFSIKYSCLKNLPVQQYRIKLYDFYTQHPAKIIKMLGPETICVPFQRVPDNCYNYLYN